ncbi:hypothetical protein OF117_07650 [Geodermatophilus sp. YIM 151500]|uniref:hypothetical protein n=1 Tax=Geodermatophilus sp. YIM 151500 TaxID=2984531 RepID=UPI0021E4C455|nr:hypothetical protein [Geodermatophilus sp. YIM 151500]MCV2489236.1 hypothetical protein [Geodermatophilus sp. YIM 151500]
MTTVPTPTHPFARAVGDVAWRCECGKTRKAAVHRGAASLRRPAGSAPGTTVTVPTSKLTAGEPVLTTDVVGTDFGLPLVRPTKSRRESRVRVVRSHCRAHGGVVVWFTDGTKTPPIHGRTAWIVAEPDPTAQMPVSVPA